MLGNHCPNWQISHLIRVVDLLDNEAKSIDGFHSSFVAVEAVARPHTTLDWRMLAELPVIHLASLHRIDKSKHSEGSSSRD